MGFSAAITLNRNDYGISFSRPDNPTFLGNDVDIDLNVITKAGSPQ
jgi:polyisoprenoid-binding protein YceI